MLEDVVSVLGASLEELPGVTTVNAEVLFFEGLDPVTVSLYHSLYSCWKALVSHCHSKNHVVALTVSSVLLNDISIHAIPYPTIVAPQRSMCALPCLAPVIAHFHACGTICLRVRLQLDADTLARYPR